jgi:hypothetical protein
MSSRFNKKRGKQGIEPKRPPPSHLSLEAIQGMTNVMMCRGCSMKIFCQRPMQCEEEGKLEARIAMIRDEMGEDELKLLKPPEILQKMRVISDADVKKFMIKVLSDVNKISEDVNKATDIKPESESEPPESEPETTEETETTEE